MKSKGWNKLLKVSISRKDNLLEKNGNNFTFASLLISMLSFSLLFPTDIRTVQGTLQNDSIGWTGQLRNTQ